MNVRAAHRALVAEVAKAGKPDGDPWLQKYVGSPYRVLGLSVPTMREMIRRLLKEHPELDTHNLHAIAALLWKGKNTEEKSLAILLLEQRPRWWNEATWRLVKGWIPDARGWGLCDGLGGGLLAEMVYGRPSRLRELERWTQSPSLWRRRIALYALKGYVYRGELDLPLRVLGKVLYDGEFWVQRAVGTWLRECWKKDPRRVEEYL